jgi:hypothetical protein
MEDAWHEKLKVYKYLLFMVHVACHADLMNFMMVIIFGEECK